MVVFPRAKINIGLRIIEKRPDGFHNLETIFYPIKLSDALEYVVPDGKTEGDQLVETGLLTGCPQPDNIVLKALVKLREKYHIPFLKIHLHKVIPSGAGLGGGSSDAACFLISLNRYFNLGLARDELKEMSASLGSDCPFFIDGVPSYGEGRGEILTPVAPVPESLNIVILKPDAEVNTAEAYRRCTPFKNETKLVDIYNSDVRLWKDTMVNDFEKTVFPEYPVIASAKAQLYRMGALYSSMSGSGSSVYGIFRKAPDIPDSLKHMVFYAGIL